MKWHAHAKVCPIPKYNTPYSISTSRSQSISMWIRWSISECVYIDAWCMYVLYIGGVSYSRFQKVTHMDSSLIYRLLSPLAAGSHSSVNPSCSLDSRNPIPSHVPVPLHSVRMGMCAKPAHIRQNLHFNSNVRMTERRIWVALPSEWK